MTTIPTDVLAVLQDALLRSSPLWHKHIKKWGLTSTHLKMEEHWEDFLDNEDPSMDGFLAAFLCSFGDYLETPEEPGRERYEDETFAQYVKSLQKENVQGHVALLEEDLTREAHTLWSSPVALCTLDKNEWRWAGKKMHDLVERHMHTSTRGHTLIVLGPKEALAYCLGSHNITYSFLSYEGETHLETALGLWDNGNGPLNTFKKAHNAASMVLTP